MTKRSEEHIHAFLPAEDAVAVFGLIDSLAHCAVPGDERGIDARRADALVDLIVRPNGEERIRYVIHTDQNRPGDAAEPTEAPAFLRGYKRLRRAEREQASLRACSRSRAD